MKNTPIRVILALASAGAGVIHFLVTPEHFEEFLLFGLFFLVLGAFQVLWAGGMLAKPNTFVLLAGVVVSAVVIGIWVLSRTAGLPMGPEAGEAEAAALPDILSTVLEGVIVLGGTYLLLGRAGRTAEEPAWSTEERRAA
jgi:hypothetical protein